jgi:hypothetical protein
MKHLNKFEQFIADEFFDDNADLMILDDDMLDVLNRYLSEISYPQVYAKAQKYYQKHPPLLKKVMGDDFVEFFYDPAEQLAKEYCKFHKID